MENQNKHLKKESKIMKDSFIVRNEWWSAIKELSAENQATIFQNLFLFHTENKNLINLDNLEVKLVWLLIEPSLVRSITAYNDRVVASRENGKKGGRPKKKSGDVEKPNKPRKGDSVPVPVPVPVSDSVLDSDKSKKKNTKEKLLDYLKSQLSYEHPLVLEKAIEFFNFRYEIKKGFKSEKGIDGVIRNLDKLKYPIHKIEMIQLSLDREYSGLFPDNIDTTKDIVDWKLVMRTLTPIEYGDLLGSPSIKDKLREMIKNLEVEQTTEAIRNFWNINGVHDYSKEIAEATTGLFGS